MTTLGNQISKNVIDAMNTSDNPRVDKDERTKKRSHSSRARASIEDEGHSRHKCQKLRNNSCRDKSQIREKRKVREVSSSESSEDDQISCQNDGNQSLIAILKWNGQENKRTAWFTSGFQQWRATIQRLH